MDSGLRVPAPAFGLQWTEIRQTPRDLPAIVESPISAKISRPIFPTRRPRIRTAGRPFSPFVIPLFIFFLPACKGTAFPATTLRHRACETGTPWMSTYGL